jgi:hypothetical protein
MTGEMMDRLGVVIAAAAGILTGSCGSGGSTEGTVRATIAGASWQAPGRGFVVTGAESTSFTLLGATSLPDSPLVDSSKPLLQIVFPQGLPAVGTYDIDGVTVNVEYQVDTSTFYSGSNGSIQVTSMETSRAQGVFNFELQSPINDPMVLIVTDGVFDVPVSVH